MIPFIKRTFLIVLLIFINMDAYAVPYGNYNLEKIPQKKEEPSGTKYSLDINYLDTILQDLMQHAFQYPAKFDSAEEKKRATLDTLGLISMLNIYINNTPNPHFYILGRGALVNHIGYTLNIPDSDKRATELYQRLLKSKPDDQESNYFYGVFLLSSGKCKQSVNYFDKAIKGGYIYAQLIQGVAYISCGDKKNALRALNAYREKRPDDEKANYLINAIEADRFEIKNIQ